MRCYFEGKVKTSADSISVDFIEIVKCSNGKTIVLDWDESEIGFDDIPDEDGYRPFSGRLIGIKFDEEYANGKISEIIGAELSAAQFFIEDEITENPVFTELQLDDDGVLCDFDLSNVDVEYTIIDA